MAKKVLVCSNAYPPHFVGGAELIAHYHAQAMQRSGMEACVFAGDTMQPAPRYAMEETRYDGLTVFRVQLRGDDFRVDYENFYHPQVEAHFEEVLERTRPDVVHFHNLIGLSVGIIRRARRRGLRTVMTVHDHWAFCLKNTLLRQDGAICGDFARCAECQEHIDSEAIRRIPILMRQDFFAEHLADLDFIISPSRYLAGAYMRAGVPPEKMRVIGYGIDTKRLTAVQRVPDPTQRRFTFVGYLGEHKGVHVLLEAMRLLASRPEIRLTIVGTGHLEPALRERVKQQGLERQVHFAGKIGNDQIGAVLEKTDALILPSIWPENQPVTILEARAAGLPVIGSRIGGIPEIVEDGKTGLLFEPGNPRDLAKKIRELADHPALIDAFGQAGRARSTETFDTQAAQVMRLYDEPAAPDEARRPLVLCLGHGIEAKARQAIKEYAASEGVTRPLRFLMREWAPEETGDAVAFFWIMDDAMSFDSLQALLRQGVPLVGRRENRLLAEICRSYECGMVYSDAAEALACLRFLARHPEQRRAMGVHARRGLMIAGFNPDAPHPADRPGRTWKLPVHSGS